jgi:hypothetical protein
MSEEFSPDPDPGGGRRFDRAVDAALHKAPEHRESKGKASPKEDQKAG